METQGNRYGTLGILWLIYGIVMIMAAAFIVVYNGTLTLMWGAIITRVPDALTWMSAFHLFLGATVVMALISAFFSVAAGFALMRGAGSSRRLGLIAAAFGLLGAPPGVALGAFTVAMLYPLGAGRASSAQRHSHPRNGRRRYSHPQAAQHHSH